MRPAVRAAFVAFTSPIEGVVPWMYQDVKGLVTVAIGNLIDPIQYALPLPFVWPHSGTPATRDEIANEWLRVKRDGALAALGHQAAKHATELRLTDEGVSMLVARKLEQNDGSLRNRFPDLEDWPACAQLAAHSMAWACGPAFRFPRLEAALRAQDWDSAADECHMNEAGNPGLRPRNVANRLLFRNAAHVVAYGLDPDLLEWVHDLAAVDPSADTLPAPIEGAVEPIVVVHAYPDTVSEAQRRDE